MAATRVGACARRATARDGVAGDLRVPEARFVLQSGCCLVFVDESFEYASAPNTVVNVVALNGAIVPDQRPGDAARTLTKPPPYQNDGGVTIAIACAVLVDRFTT
jgi:hypothetical protein